MFYVVVGMKKAEIVLKMIECVLLVSNQTNFFYSVYCDSSIEDEDHTCVELKW